MAKITLEVDEKNRSTVINILQNLKAGLIKDIKIQNQEQIKPISSSINNQNNKKYLSKDAYKKRLSQKVLEDDFLPKTNSSSKYLSKEAFKQKLKGNK